ncbi:IPExxxVDY family protein [Pedobacter sp. SD-b]|uniref:IPExxxVDY family protein n=1 Tax=Pedobacter segetis TaxID=2793069 RepID=A0ABS1BH64_9SPHI|nr:IPExxxVDY family protein [Pedobacter segetis]MBK0382193.1 IPExxxVDY family protein [Pedobacter segetis]
MIKKFLKLELDFNFILLAITSQLKDYRLCYAINKYTETAFRKDEDLTLAFKNAPVKYFSKYLYCPEGTECEFYLIANKGNEGYLIPEMKETDYFILIKEFIDEEDLDLLISRLRLVNEIQVVIDIDPSKLKSKENLIF